MKRKWIATTLACTMLAAALTGCRGETETETRAPAADASAGAAADGELEGEITFWHSFTQGARMDAVQAASFITDKKTKVLIGKIAQLAGDKKAEVLQKNTVEFHTPKSDNEQIFYIVDKIGSAIEQRRQISFVYFDYDILYQRVYRKEKRRYVVNPLSTVFSNDNYYLMCYDDKHGNIGHYRIDRMDEVDIEQTPINETEESKKFDLSRHKRALFEMFSGEDAKVSFQADKTLIDHIFDKFGKSVHITYGEGNTVVFTANVQVSKRFLGWCCSFGDMLKVTAPKEVADQVKEQLSETANQYD